MADNNDLFVENSEGSLEDFFVLKEQEPAPFPQSAIRNRAATTAFLSEDADKSVQNFQNILSEAAVGEDGTLTSMEKGIYAANEQQNLKSVINILSDPSMPLEQKESVIQSYRNSIANPDTSEILATNSLIADSQGESPEEEASRISTADWADESNRARIQVQGMINAIKLSEGGGTVPEALEAMFLPFANSAVGAQLEFGNGKTKWTDLIKAGLLPGSTKQDLREAWQAMTPDQKLAASTAAVEAVRNANGLLFSRNNQFVSMMNLQDIYGDEYNTFDKWMDNMSSFLDIVGLGFTIKGVKSASRASRVAEEARAARVEPSFAAGEASAAERTSGGSLAQQLPEAQVMRNASDLAKAEAEHSELLSRVQSRLEPGDVRNLRSELDQLDELMKQRPDVKAEAKRYQTDNGMKYKDALARAEKEAADYTRDLEGRQAAVRQRLEINSSSEAAQSRLSALERQIAILKKDQEVVSARYNPIMDSLRRAEMNSVGRMDNPASPGSILSQNNPEKARQAHSVMFMAQTDEVAQSLYGTSKVEAIANNVLPQATTESGRITAKVGDIDKDIRKQFLNDIEDVIRDGGGIEFSPDELAAARAHVVNDFRGASGLTVNDAMGGLNVSEDGANLTISAAYGLPNGGWLKAEDAIEQAMYSLRGYGVKPEEVQILQKQGLDYVPVNLEDVRGVDGNYMIRVNVTHPIEVQDMSNFSKFDVKRSWFSNTEPMMGAESGGLQQWIFDAASTLHPTLSGSAVTGIDRSSRLEKVLLSYSDDFVQDFKRLPTDRKAAMEDYIKEANFKGIPQTYTDLKARGFTDPEIKTLAKWKTFWDGHYYLENLDVVRSLRRDGYQTFKNDNVELFARPVAKNISMAKVYDPASDTVLTMTREAMDELYDKGGTIAKLRRPAKLGGDTAEQMIVRNTPQEYLKGLRDDDMVLNKRPGYFQITYKAPRFVEEIIRDANGVETGQRVVAVAGDTKEARDFAKRSAASNGRRFDPKDASKSDYRVRGDDRVIQRDSDAYWDLQSATGRIAQRHRGKLLEDAAGMNHLGNTNYIEDPINSALRASKSISGRTVMRPVLEAAKARFVDQYGDLILSTNEFGQKVFPRSISQVGAKGKQAGKDLRDARTTYSQIRYWEEGYINALDQSMKGMFNALSETMGNLELSGLERFTGKMASGTGFFGAAKKGVFMAYLGLFPWRQWVVQGHQAIRTAAYNPTAFFGGKTTKLMGEYALDMVGAGARSQEGREFVDFLKSTGMLDALDQNNLVRSALESAGGKSGKIAHTISVPMDFSRRIGFDVGEGYNIIMHSAAVFDKYKRAGEDVTSAVVRSKMHSEARAIMLDMNYAGDFAYNQNFASVALQFAQVPHKSFLQIMNRRIPLDTRLRMFAADTALWGSPFAGLAYYFGDSVLPQNPQLKEALTEGVEGMLLNNLLQMISSDDTEVDFSSLNPFDMTSMGRMFTAVWTEGMGGVIANSPAGTLFAKDGGRFSEAYKSLGRFFNVLDDDIENPTDALDVLDMVGRVASGWSAIQKSRMALELRKALDNKGRITDEDVTALEAGFMAFGFGTKATKDFYETSKKLSDKSKEHKKQAEEAADNMLRLAAQLNENEPDRAKVAQKAISLIMRQFEADPVGLQIAQGRLRQQLEGPQQQLVRQLMNVVNLPQPEKLRDTIHNLPGTDEEKRQALEIVEDVVNMRNQYYKKGK